MGGISSMNRGSDPTADERSRCNPDGLIAGNLEIARCFPRSDVELFVGGGPWSFFIVVELCLFGVGRACVFPMVGV